MLKERLLGEMRVFVGLLGDWLKMGKVDQKVILIFAKNVLEWY